VEYAKLELVQSRISNLDNFLASHEGSVPLLMRQGRCAGLSESLFLIA